LQIRQPFVAKAKDILGWLVLQGEDILSIFFRIFWRRSGFLLLETRFRPAPAPDFLPIAQRRSGFDGPDSSIKYLLIGQISRLLIYQFDNLGTFGDVIFDRLGRLQIIRETFRRDVRKLGVKRYYRGFPKVSFPSFHNYMASLLGFKTV
jgi:hypothetical protein